MNDTALWSVINPFWAAVCGDSEPVEAPEISAPALDAAARIAFAATGRSYGFRRPRELVDLDGQFRHFSFRGRAFVGKRTRAKTASREVRNGRLSAERLAGSTTLEPLVPSAVRVPGSAELLLVSEDRGPSLAHRPAEISDRLPWAQFLQAMGALVDVGIEWSGFLPRNVIPAERGHLVLIDWESCRFLPGQTRCRRVGDLSLLFWSIAWAEHYGRDATEFGDELCRSLGLTRCTEPLDAFELAYASMFGGEVDQSEVRRRCSAATILTESSRVPSGTYRHNAADPDVPLGPAEVGHLLNELLPPHLSVLYTFASSAYLERRGQDALSAFIRLANEVLTLMTPADGFEGRPASRQRLQFVLFAAITTVLVEGVTPELLLGVTSEGQLRQRICDSGTAVPALLRTTSADLPQAASTRPILQMTLQSLGIGGEALESPMTQGLRCLSDEISELAKAYVTAGENP